MYTEGGGGRPGDTDVTTQIAGFNVADLRPLGSAEYGLAADRHQ
jgi:hypothetical protein